MKKIIISFIILLAAVLRLYNLTSLPALNADEAAIGYNAYSLLETGKDEHGHPWPIHFQSFNDYKPGLYFYIVMPFVKFLGLNELAVRLPSALLAIGTVYVLWLLIKLLFPNKKWLPEISALFLAISPWHIHYSRGGWEVNVATFFILLGMYLFIKGRNQANTWIWSIVCLVAAMYTYHAARIIVPLLGIGLGFYYWKDVVNQQKKTLVKLTVVLALFLLPLGYELTSPSALSRASGVGLFSDLGPLWRANEQRGEHEDYSSVQAKLLHNRPANYSLSFLANYAKHFSGEFLFISGDVIERNRVPEIGQMYLLDLVFLIVGFLAIAKKSKGWGVILLWLVVAPIPASFTFQSPHALRAENMIIPLTVIGAYGGLELVKWLTKLKFKILGVSLAILLFIGYSWDFTRYLHQYYYHMAKTYDYSSQYGAKELVGYVEKHMNDYSRTIITTRYDQPYILFLFYLKYPPQKFQVNHSITPKDKFGFSTVQEFDKFTFKKIESVGGELAESLKLLVVYSPDEAGDQPMNSEIVQTIYFPSGRPAFHLIKRK